MYDAHTALPIVVGIDGSDAAVAAARWAAVEAAGRDVEIQLVYVIAKDELERRYGARALDLAETAVRETDRSIAVASPLLLRGPLVPTLCERTESASLLVLGPVGTDLVPRVMLGSTAAALAATAACPVAVVRGTDEDSPPRSTSPVIVALGGHDVDAALVGAAMHEAEIRGTHVLAARAEPALPGPRGRRALTAEQEFEDEVGGRVGRWRGDFPEVPVNTMVVYGEAADALASLSSSAQMVVMGCRGRDLLEEAALGSTSHALLHSARCPVFVYREPTGTG
ncbi:universal stress protein [Rhodococcus olei]|uniref:universal stress protein n=1 Tax=Rhodococcus olei TaxID=2161675 RepID=UPI0031E664DC